MPSQIVIRLESAVHIWDPAGDVVSCRVVSWLLCPAVSAVAITHSAELLAWSSQDGVVLQQAGTPEPCARWSLPVLEPLLVNALRASSPADRVGRWRGVAWTCSHGTAARPCSTNSPSWCQGWPHLPRPSPSPPMGASSPPRPAVSSGSVQWMRRKPLWYSQPLAMVRSRSNGLPMVARCL